MADTELFQYLATLMPGAPIQCAGCPVEVEAAQAVTRADNLYCSKTCADRATARLVKPQPKGVNLDGWDV